MSGTGTGSPEVREPAQRRGARRISEFFQAGNIRGPNGTVSVSGGKENDMKEGLLSIGEMARLNHITIATLRLYDREGLLKPAFVDPDSGYRYYDIYQNARLDMIAYMKELGMRLQEIQTVLSTEDITRIEAILAEKYEQIHKEIRALEIRRNAVERAIRAMERYRKSSVKGTISLEYNDRRYLWSIPAQNNFYEGDLSDFETCLTELRFALIENGFPGIHTYSIGTSIARADYERRNFVADKVFIFGDHTLNKLRKDMTIVESGMYACIYTDRYEDELSYADRLLSYCEENHFSVSGDYICEILSEFNVFDEKRRNMFIRLQVPVKFPE